MPDDGWGNRMSNSPSSDPRVTGMAAIVIGLLALLLFALWVMLP